MKKLIFRILIWFITLNSIFLACQSPAGNVQKSEIHEWLLEMTISELQQGYRDEKYSIADVVSAYLDRIIAIDMDGPSLNSVIKINPDAIEIAEELDREMAEGKIRGPLHGVPVILKDNIDTEDNMPTTAGATALRDSYAAKDSYIAAKLREAGAVIIAKANLSEWANFRAYVSSSGWSGVGGQTRNPYVLDRNPCGSSSGSGVAVSANLCMAAVGTETDGSIVCPSNNCGVVGIKPTVGLLSRTGIIPISYTQDTPGPMCRTVEDAAFCLGAMTGVDLHDAKTLASEGRFLTDYTKFLKADGMKGKRIGIVKNSGGFNNKVDSLMIRAIKRMAALGAELVEVEAPARREYEDAELQVLLFEFKDGLNKYFAGLGENAPVKTIKDLIEFNKKDTVELRYFDQKILIDAEKKGDLNSPEYLIAIEKCRKATRDEGIDKMMNAAGLDAIILPTGSPAWKTDLLNGDHYVGGSSSLAAIAGYPAITIPMGFIDDLPVGITFVGRAWSEPLLIEVAYSYEQATQYRKAPEYLVTD
ncbi:MAG: amidase [Bacteroidales bacterium]|jgi:amidase|nr:amidase [Bacteroidales bacterium]